MRTRIAIHALLLSPLAFAACADSGGSGGGPDNPTDGAIDLAAVDAVFADFATEDGPGCALAVSQDGRTTLTRAYGMANLEYDIPNTGETIFEPGSVSKQFTAAATIMMSLDGLIDLDDDIREYFPELPDYGEPITIRNLLHHTSGLRDWGSIAGIEGWQRTTRIHSHKHVLDIASRQRALNYPPGEYYSYTNTGYNLQAMLVERVTGQTLDEYSQERIFGPLGMTKTQWRDDFTEVVDDRSVGYVRRDGEWHMLMPFENVHGNGGLLTTVGDLLKFTRNLDTGEVGGPLFIEEMHRQGVLDDGREIEYAAGLFIQEYKGLRQVAHSGGTAAYRGYLTRYPDQGLAVSVMCNAGNANAGGLAHEVVDLYLADAIADSEEAVEGAGVEVAAGTLASYEGAYRHPLQNQLLSFTVVDGTLRAGPPGGQGAPLTAVSETRFEHPAGISVTFEPGPNGDPIPVLETPTGSPARLQPVDVQEPTAADLASYAGVYHSDEAEVTYTVAVEDGQLRLVDRYGDGRPLRPAYRDAFVGPGGMVLFRRNESGRVTGLSISQGRVWDLRFQRVE
jgi:CubicO group peptidase (beta-lactamase class C family)